MEWDRRLQAIIDYAEQRLQCKEEAIDPKEVEALAGCSYPFFQRVFSYASGIGFAEYIRARKMTLAGYDLKSTDMKVVDISYKYGYESPTAFTRAFQQFHGVPPKEAREREVELNVLPKMHLSGHRRYAWRLERRPSLRLVGKSTAIPCQDGQQAAAIPAFWAACRRDGTFARLAVLDSAVPRGMYGLFTEYDEAAGTLRYAIMVQAEGPAPGDLCELVLPAATWAVFDCRGPVPGAVQSGWKYLNEEWLVQYPFRHAPCPELEWYSEGDAGSEEYLTRICIPILEEE